MTEEKRPRSCTRILLGGMLIAAVTAQLPGRAAQPQTPELGAAAGVWATAVSAAGVVDEIRLSTPATGGLFLWLVRRDGGRETESGIDAGATWDGRALRARVESTVASDPRLLLFSTRSAPTTITEIDLAFDPKASLWVGTFARDGKRRRVELKRRGAFVPGPMLQQLLGRWCTTQTDTSILLDGTRTSVNRFPCFTIVVAAAGELSGSTDRAGLTIDVPAGSDAVFLSEQSGGCCANWFSGRLSADGTRIDGTWWFGKTPERPHVATFVKTL